MLPWQWFTIYMNQCLAKLENTEIYSKCYFSIQWYWTNSMIILWLLSVGEHVNKLVTLGTIDKILIVSSPLQLLKVGHFGNVHGRDFFFSKLWLKIICQHMKKKCNRCHWYLSRGKAHVKGEVFWVKKTASKYLIGVLL